MIIENLKLRRFGGHESIDFTTDGSVVGVFGPNGSGKSTLLEGLKFAITGETEAAQSAYVKDLTGSATATLRFRKNGKVGKIERNIGTKSTRALDWDGRHIVAAKDVSATMADIFGADKKAVANAVFISQGHMQGMLFAGSAERRDAFVELLNLSFCAGRADILWRKVQKLQSTMVDLTPARDAALSQRDVSAQAYLDKKQALEGTYSWDIEVQYLADTQQANTEKQLFQAQHNQASTDHQMKVSELSGLLGSFGYNTVAEVEGRLNASSEQLAGLDMELRRKQSIAAELSHYTRVNGDISAIYKELAGVSVRVFTADPDNAGLLEWMKRKGGLDADEKSAVRRKQLQESLAREAALYAKNSQMAIADPGVDEAGLALMATKLEQASLDARTHSKNLQMQREIVTCFAGGDIAGTTTCPKCDLTITDANRLSPEEIARMEEIEAALIDAKRSAESAYKSAKFSWDRYAQETHSRGQMLAAGSQAIAELTAELETLPLIDLVVVAAEREKIDSVIGVLRTEAAAEASARRRLQAKLTERNGYTQALHYAASRSDYSEEVIGGLVCQKTELNTKLSQLRTQLQTLNQVQREIDRLSRLKTSLQGEIALRDKALSVRETQELDQLRATIGDGALLQLEVKARHTTWLELRAQVKQLEESYATANAAFQDIEVRMARDEQKRLLIVDLLKLKELLSNDGLPLAYSRLQFEKLAILAQDNLTKLNAAFSIELDRSRDLAFSFKRLDRDGGVLLPMASLSGGQRVRLCVAFLIAVQKHLVPDVGLLVPDEPTTSVDDEGRAEIAEFLSGLGRELQNTEMQIWVCDHSAEIRDRIECKIQL